MASQSRPRVLALGYPAYAGDTYVAEFEKDYDIHVVQPTNRHDTVANVAAAAAKSDGPFDALLVRMGIGPYEPFDEELLQPLLPSLKIIVSCSAGYNEFDVAWMTRHGIWFCNTRRAVSEATADVAIFLMLAVLRDTTRGEKQAREGQWRGSLVPSRDPTDLTLGILGLGMIGKFMAKKAHAFNMKVKYYNRNRLSSDEEQALGVSYCSTMKELLAVSDVFSICCPLNAQTTKLIGHAEFAQMKDGVFFINTARGPIVDEEALVAALESGKVERAGLDVFDGEPNINPYFAASPRCTILPHVGGLSDVAYKKAEIECLENLKSFFAAGKPIAPVNAL